MLLTPDEQELDNRRESLDQSGNAPRPVGAEIVGTKRDPGDGCSRILVTRQI